MKNDWLTELKSAISGGLMGSVAPCMIAQVPLPPYAIEVW